MSIVKNIQFIKYACIILTFLGCKISAAFPIVTDDIFLGTSYSGVARSTIKPGDLTHFSEDFIPERFRIVSDLNCSGSHQYTFKELQEILTSKIPIKNKNSVIFIDLREEPHLMHYSSATASIQSATAMAYNGLSHQAIQATENSFVQAYPSYRTEDACVKRLGAHYYRIPVTDATRPEDSDVDRFINLLRSIQGQNYWLHFHCLAGLGRTTTFMAMYEMIKTAHLEGISLDDILEHQHKIGGANLAFMWYSSSRTKWLNFLENFYEYSRNGFHHGMSWSQWVEHCHLERFQEYPTLVSKCSLSYFCTYVKSVAMMGAMRLTQLSRGILGD
jgi:protein tyrosine phosphatase (PTP) superfamily phosphohydrolase (DUF442 family)